MQVAHDQANSRCIAWEVEKSQGPFYCPECKGALILKKGRVREHHFAHRPPFTCQYSSGESEIHYRAKRELFTALSAHPLCKKCELERSLKGVRPDISLYIENHPVAIEIQRSSVTVDDIIKKAEAYNRLGTYLLYLFPESGPNLTWRDNEQEYVCRPNQWEKFLHSMFFGRVYYWVGGLQVRPYHFSEFKIWVEPRWWYDEDGDSHYGGDYDKKSKLMKMPIDHPDVTLNIVEDFHGRNRERYELANFTIPSCKLWMDGYDIWW
ncbi:MAG: competence protein CoiA [Deltaproteobacteria bacterium]|nr:competence protein CoiA [Deltaproteobacteria bacterium]